MPAATEEVIFIVLLILANSFFALSEIAVVVARKSRLEEWANSGSRRARAALALANNPGRFLSTMQLGITLVSILTGVFSGAAIAEALALRLKRWPLLASHSETVSLVCVVGAVTYLSTVIGELVPKRLALQRPERIATAMARPLTWMSEAAAPAVYLFNKSSEFVLRFVRINPSDRPPVTEEEIRLLLDQGTQAGIFEKAERVMVERVFRLADYTVAALMTSRENIVWLRADEDARSLREKVLKTHYSRFPVHREGTDRVAGVVHAQDLLTSLLGGKELRVTAVMRKPLTLSEGSRVLKLLELFRRSGAEMAFALDKRGNVSGLITPDDILRAIVGDLPGVDEFRSNSTQNPDVG